MVHCFAWEQFLSVILDFGGPSFQRECESTLAAVNRFFFWSLSVKGMGRFSTIPALVAIYFIHQWNFCFPLKKKIVNEEFVM